MSRPGHLSLVSHLRGKECKGMSFTFSFEGGSLDLGNGIYKEFKPVSGYVCHGLFSIGEYGFRTRKMISI
ncbi:hypothetical protein Bca4012_042542 [Brassica carinata]